MTEINISCRECGSCNRKGKVSAMRGSSYCDGHRKKIVFARKGIFGWISKRFFSDAKDKMIDKRLDEKTGERNLKGFRLDWFLR